MTPARELLADRYELLGLVGVGGMGSVYRARDIELDEIVALKVLRRDLVDTPGILDRFRREVKLARRITHKNVARVFDIGEHGGEKFLTMEFIDGEPLSAILAREGALRVGRAMDIASGICTGLCGAHAAGVIHRDLKPDNVLLSKDGRVIVTDFGIARAYRDAEAALVKTMGALMGTPAYMSPEQVEGRSDIDARADIYALGALLFELFTGHRAWEGESPFAVAAARLNQPPPDPRKWRPELPEPLVELVMRCMARQPDDRFAAASEITEILDDLALPPAPASARSVFPRPRHSSGPMSAVRGVGGVIPSGADRMPLADAAPGDKSDKTVAVLPFRNSGPAEDDYLAEELMDDLIDSLSVTRGLKVRARNAALKFKGSDQDPREIGRELGVQVVVEGSVRRARGNVRVSARLISVADGFQLWAKRFDRPEQDVLSINDDAATAIAEALTVDHEAKSREAPSDPAAIDLYLRARHEYRRLWAESQDRALEFFEQAEKLAPGDPMILSGKAMALARRAFFLGGSAPEAREVAEQAVAVAPTLAEARLALGSVLLQMGDFQPAARELRQAISRGPGLAEAHAALGRLLAEVGALEEATRRLEAAVALDPKVPLAASSLARCYALLGEMSRFDERIGDVRESEGEGPYYVLVARIALWRRDRARAEKILRRMNAAEPRLGLPRTLLEIAVLGRRPEGAQLLSTHPLTQEWGTRRRAFFLQLEAEVEAYIGARAACLAALRRAVEADLIDIAWFDRCPLFEDLRSDPEFLALRAVVKRRADEILEAYFGADTSPPRSPQR